MRDAGGRFLGRFDGVDDATRSIYEYDGEQHHFSLRQRRRDPKRLQAARVSGWRIMVLYSEDCTDSSLLDTGTRMLAFCGQRPSRIPARLARLLDERSGAGTVSAIAYRSWGE